MQNNRTTFYLVLGICIAAVALTGFFFLEARRQNAQLAELLARAPGKDGKPAVDPYIAGPVKNRVLKGYGELNACYRAYLETKPAKKSGKLRIDWQITTSGRSVSPEVILSDFGNSAFEKCITDKIANWSFPEPSAQKYIEHTFRFDEKGDDAKATASPKNLRRGQ